MYFIISHRRSGGHYLTQLLKKNYQIKSTVRHVPIEKRKENWKHIILVRDPRDVLVACYFYYKKLGYFQLMENLSIQEFIRGVPIRIEDIESVIFRNQHWSNDMFSDPIGFWVSYVSDWMNEGHQIRYENIFNDLKRTFGSKKLVDHEGLCGPFTRNKKIGEYKEYLTEDDIKLFDEKAGKLMDFFGYKSP